MRDNPTPGTPSPPSGFRRKAGLQLSPVASNGQNGAMLRGFRNTGWQGWLGGAPDLLAPPCCGFCGSAPPEDLRSLCRACLMRLEEERYPACRQCAAVLAIATERCGACLARPDFPLRGVTALFPYQGIGRGVIQKLKRDSDGVIARSLMEAWRLRVLSEGEQGWVSGIDLVVSIPQRPRFPWEPKNAAPVRLALALGSLLEKPAKPSVLQVRKWLRSQHELSVRQRQVNVRRAYRVAAQNDIKGRGVLLVDDVMTSGATLCSAAQTLLDAGAREVWGAVVARGQAFGAVHPYSAGKTSRPKSPVSNTVRKQPH